MSTIGRRAFLQLLTSAVPALATEQSDPWSVADLIEPADLASRLEKAQPMLIICVAFPVLYRQRHIKGAVLAGPGSKPEGVGSLKTALKGINTAERVVLYCGCCPMPQCPNIRPAYLNVKEMGFAKVSVLNLPHNFHTDWVEKAYPLE